MSVASCRALEHLGHSSHAVTADIHSHVTRAQQREAADRVDEAFP